MPLGAIHSAAGTANRWPPISTGRPKGAHRFVSLLSREAADELGLEPGVLAVASIKAANVSIEMPSS